MKSIIFIALLFSVSVSLAGTLMYTYDDGGRLQRAHFHHTGGHFAYEMDAAGNIKEQTTDPVPEPSLIWGVGVCALLLWRRQTRAV